MRAITSRALLALTFAAGLNGVDLDGAGRRRPGRRRLAAGQRRHARPSPPPFNQAQDLLKSGNGAAALAKLKEIEALPNLTPYEQYLILRVRAPAEYSMNDFTAAAADFESPAGRRPAAAARTYAC